MNAQSIRVLILPLVVALSTLAAAQGPPNILWQANDNARTVAFSRSGSLIADAGPGVNIIIRNISNGQLIRSIRDKSGINSLSFSPDASLIAEGRTNGSSGGNLKVYRVSDGLLVLNLMGHSNATKSVAFSPNGTLLASGGDDKLLKFWRVSDGALQRTVAVGSRVRPIAFAADGVTIATGDQVGNVKIWRVTTGELVRTLGGFTGEVTKVTYSPDRTLLVASSIDGTIRIWRVSDGALLRVISVPVGTPNGATTSVAFSVDGTTLLSGNDETVPSPEHGTLRSYRVSDGSLLRFYDQETGVYVSSVAYAPTGRTYAYTRQLDGMLIVATMP